MRSLLPVEKRTDSYRSWTHSSADSLTEPSTSKSSVSQHTQASTSHSTTAIQAPTKKVSFALFSAAQTKSHPIQQIKQRKTGSLRNTYRKMATLLHSSSGTIPDRNDKNPQKRNKNKNKQKTMIVAFTFNSFKYKSARNG